MIKRFLAIIVFLGFFQVVYAQECTAVLDEAKKEFAAGHLEVISSLLNDCLHGNFTDEQKIEAYKLLTITYLYLDFPHEAEQSFMELLEIDHEYRISESDPVELQYLSKKFITTPIISFTGKAGANVSTVTVLHRNTVSAEPDDNWKYTPGFGFNVMAGMDLHFNKIVSLNFELDLSSRSYVYTDVLFSEIEPQDIEQKRTNLHASLPVSLKFTYPGITYYPYVYAGYSPSYTLISQGNDKREPRANENIVGPSIDLLGKTKAFSHSLIFGIGVKRRFKYNYVLVDLRYRLGMTNMLDEKKQYNFDNDQIREEQFRYLQSGDDLRWNGLELSVGFTIPKYKVRAKNTVTIQTVVSDLFSKKKKKDE